MGVFDSMKSKLGFGGGQQEWQEEPYQPYEQTPYDDYADQPYDDGYADDAPAQGNNLLNFDSYNPDNFAHVNLDSDRELKVATMDDTQDSYFSRKANYGSNIGTSASRATSAGSHASSSSRRSSSSSWDSPESPAFRGAADFVSSISNMRNNPAEHLAIVKAYAYADAEQVGSALREGKVVVLVLTNTRPELAKRILDFSFGAASVLNATVDKQADKVFVISRGAKSLSDAETDYLKEQGVL